MFETIKFLIKKILPHKIEDNYHYGKFLGSFNFFRLFFWNLFHPNRIFRRVAWKSLNNNKEKKIKIFNKKKTISFKKISTENLSYFLDNGGVLLKNFFSNKEIDNFLNEYRYLIGTKKEKKLNQEIREKKFVTEYHRIKLYLTKPLIDIWLNSEIIEFIKCFLDTDKIYAREYPKIIYTNYTYNEELKSKNMHNGKYDNLVVNGPYFWHVDHTAGLVNFHVLLQDIDDLTETHMQFLPGSNNFLNSRDLYSDETVDKFINKPFDCVGKKGTIYFHQGNTLHRVFAKKKSERLGLIFSFSKGAGIEFDPYEVVNLLSKKYQLEDLSKEQRQILGGILPEKCVIDIKNNNITSPKLNEFS